MATEGDGTGATLPCRPGRTDLGVVVTEASPEGAGLDDLRVLAANDTFRAWTGLTCEEVAGRRVGDLLADGARVITLDELPADQTRRDGGVGLGVLPWRRSEAAPLPAVVRVLALRDADRDGHRLLWLLEPAGDDADDRALAEGQAAVLQRLGRGDPLPEVLDTLLRVVEGLAGGACASILLLDEEGRLRHAAAPSLPAEYCAAIDGLEIGPSVGSCGTAAFTGQPVMTVDIATDPRWESFRDLALPLGLRACWSLPIRTADDGPVLGTFALYYPAPREASSRDWGLLERCRDLAAVAIQRDRLLRASADQATLSKAVLDALDTYIVLLDADGRVVTANAAWRTADTVTAAAVLGMVDSSEPYEATRETEVELITPEGPRWLHARVATLEGSSRRHLIAARDVTSRKQAEAALEHYLSHDPVTGLANRSFTVRQLDEALATGSAAVLMLDLDGFTAVNASLGPDAGDQLLRQAGQRMQTAVRPGDLVARVGGDEFAVVCPGIDEHDDAAAMAQRACAALAAPLTLGDTPIHITASVGVALAERGEVGSEALRDAATALSAAQGHGAGHTEMFTDRLRVDARSRLDLAAALRHAAERDQLRLVYQPVVTLPDERPHGVEALLRWQHPDHGLLTPDRFLDIAESTGLIIDIGRWVLQQATRQLAVWDQQVAGPELIMKVNLSPRQLSDPGLADEVAAALGEAGIPADRLVLELTEVALMHDADDPTRVLEKLKGLGVGLAIDDFGTGHSSLSRLKRFPIDTIKIDRSFVAGLGTDPEDDAIVTAIIRLADAIEVDIIAEGVETPTQRDRLNGLGCQRAQGYLFCHPLGPDALAQWLELPQ